MFERFTDRGRRVIVLAQEEARTLGHNHLGTEHILLGLIAGDDTNAARALENLGISREAVRAQVEEIIGRGDDDPAPDGHLPFTPRAKAVLELSLHESRHLDHSYIGPEHLLLGLVREDEGVAAQVLIKLGADLESVREQVVRILDGRSELADPPRKSRSSSEPRDAVVEQLAGIRDSLKEISGTLSQILRRLEDR